MFLEPISFSAAHIYVSALTHCPENTAFWEHYGGRAYLRPFQSIKPLTWSANIWTRVIECHNNTVAISPNGKVVASASADRMIRLWDAQSGILLGEPLAGHTHHVTDVTFSPDGKLLASASDDHTIRLWDVQNETPLGGPLEGHTESVSSVAFSPDGKILASGSHDSTIRLWDVQIAKPLQEPLEGHRKCVNSVASPQMEQPSHQAQTTVQSDYGVSRREIH